MALKDHNQNKHIIVLFYIIIVFLSRSIVLVCIVVQVTVSPTCCLATILFYVSYSMLLVGNISSD